MTQSDKHRLDDIGLLALVGAGKMGGAMLEGWLALGLDPQNVVVIEPQPSEEIVGAVAEGDRAQSAGGCRVEYRDRCSGGEAAGRRGRACRRLRP